MNRKEFLKKTGIGLLAGPAIIKSLGELNAQPFLQNNDRLYDCILSPEQTGGPFYLDPEFNRKDITEGLAGLPMKLKLKVLGVHNCEPIPNAVVNVWHCDVAGVYSSFGSEGTVGENWLRGYQMTNEMGECEFDSIFPGWYPIRVTHIHYDVHTGFVEGGAIDGTKDATSFQVSQIYFPQDIVTEINTSIPPYSDRGDNGPSATTDGGHIAPLVSSVDLADFPNSITVNFTIGLDMAGTPVVDPNMGVNYLESLKHFKLDQNFPNPVKGETRIRFSLEAASVVRLSIFNMEGELERQLINKKFSSGNHELFFNSRAYGSYLPPGNYIYEMQVQNRDGVFKQSKIMIIQ